MKFLLLILKNLRRNRLRTLLTSLAIIFLVAIFTMIVSVLLFLERTMAEKSADIPMVITERYRIPSRFERSHMERIVYQSKLNDELTKVPGFHADKHTIWHFIGFTVDPEMKDKDMMFFCIATKPEKMKTMVDSLEKVEPQTIELMREPPRSRLSNQGILMGPDRMNKIGKKVGDVFKAKSFSHRDGTRQPIEMEFEIVGELPGDSRWASMAFMDYAYVDRVLKEKRCDMDGMINLGWLMVDDQESAKEVAGLIEKDIPDIKCEMASTAVSRFLEPFKDIFNGVKYLLVPAICIVMMVIVANAISITVRERRTEMAVLKVLGFQPWQVWVLVIGEGLLVGAVAGLLGAVITFGIINWWIGGIKLPIAFFPKFMVPMHAFWWGPALGALTATLGGFFPAWSARSIKVSEVFAKVA